MNTIYWITRLTSIVTVSWVLFGIALVICIIGFGVYMDNREYEDDDPDKCTGKAIMKICGILSVIFLMLGIFVPTTNEAIAIYGGGKILEYVESNEKLQSMPDKVIDLTNKYIDTLDKELDNAGINKEN